MVMALSSASISTCFQESSRTIDTHLTDTFTLSARVPIPFSTTPILCLAGCEENIGGGGGVRRRVGGGGGLREHEHKDTVYVYIMYIAHFRP